MNPWLIAAIAAGSFALGALLATAGTVAYLAVKLEERDLDL